MANIPDGSVFIRISGKTSGRGVRPDLIGREAGANTNKRYRRIMVDGVRYQAHRLSWFYVYGVWPKGVIDHKFHDTHDNRMSRIRDVTESENSQNRVKGWGTVDFLGVDFHTPPGKYRARIKANGVTKLLGHFSTPEEAYAVCVVAKRELHPTCML